MSQLPHVWQGARERLFTPLRDRNFRFLWIGQTISALGNPFQTIALLWLVIQLTGSALDLAAVLLSLSIPQALTTLTGGILTDRYDARTVMLWSDSLRLITSGTLTLLVFLHWLPFWLLCTIVGIHGSSDGIFRPAVNSIVPRLLPQEALSGANSLIQTMSQLGVSFGALPAGLLVAWGGPVLAFGANALSFALAVLATLRMDPLPSLNPLTSHKSERRKPPFQAGVQGFLYVRGVPWLIAILLMDVCASTASIGPITVGLPLLTQSVFHGNPAGYSLLLWSFGCGTIVGTLLPTFCPQPAKRGVFVLTIQMIEVPILAAIPFVPLPIAACCLAASGLLNGYVSLLFLTLLQGHVQKMMLGRVMGFFMLASFGFVPLSYLATGIVMQHVGIQLAFLCAGGLMLCGALLGLSISSLRRLK